MVEISQQHKSHNNNGSNNRRNCSFQKIFIGLVILVSVLIWMSITLAVQLIGNDIQNIQLSEQHGAIDVDKPTVVRLSSPPPRDVDIKRNEKEQSSHLDDKPQPPPSNFNNGDHSLAQWIIKQRSSSINGDTDNPQSPFITTTTQSLSSLLSTPLIFPPGSLPLTQLSTLQHCHVDPQIYNHHLRGGPGGLSYSKKYNLSYILLPKSGSSTGRYMMKTEFDAVEPRGNRAVREAMGAENIIAFVREPLSRFYSQYDEAYVRTAPWQNGQNPYYVDPVTKQQSKAHPFPFLYENFESYRDYEDVFCPPSTRRSPNSRRECIFRPTKEDGTLAKRLDQFVQEYDGRNPYDVHLILQVPKLLSKNMDGSSLKITELYNTTNAQHDWQLIAKKYIGQDATFTKTNDAKNSGGVIEGRSYPRRFDKSLVAKETERRICLLALLDYCCLNFPLPSSCEEDAKELTCTMDYDDERGEMRVQPRVFPDVKSKDMQD